MSLIYDNKIKRSTAWGGDATTQYRPVSGLKIEEWLKENIPGYIHEDFDRGRFLCFADEDKYNEYLETGNEKLILLLWNNALEQGIPIYTKSYADTLVETDPERYIVIPDDSDIENSSVENKTYDTSINGPLANILFSAIRQLQSEIAKIKNTFNYGLYSYTGTNTAMSRVLGEYSSLESWRDEEEPLWAIDELGLSILGELYIGPNTSLTNLDNVVSNQEGILYINSGVSSWEIESLLSGIEDPKIILYITSNNLNVKIHFNLDYILDFSTLDYGSGIGDGLYSILLLSSNIKLKNFIWISVKNTQNDSKLLEGYLNINSNHVFLTILELSNPYLPIKIDFSNIRISKCNLYSKYLDFSEEVLSSTPSEEDYRYKVAHLTIRSVNTYNTLDKIKNQLPENELIFIEDTKQLYIKNNFELVAISASGGNNGGNNNLGSGMDKDEILLMLEEMGIVADDSGKVNFSDITFIHQETGTKFNLEIDSEGNLRTTKIQEDSLVERIQDAFNSDSIGSDSSYRGFIGRLRSKEYTKTLSSANVEKDMKLYSDRLKIGAFYAPASTNITFGCSHCFVELENTSNIDIPLEGCYLHYLKGTTDNNYIRHLALTGTIPAGGTYLIRGKQLSNFDDPNTFIKVKTFDLEWYVEGELIDFSHNGISEYINDTYVGLEGGAFALTYGKNDLVYSDRLWETNTGTNKSDAKALYPPYYIDSIVFNRDFVDGSGNSYWTIKSSNTESGKIMSYIKNGVFLDCIYRNTFELDPAKLAFLSLNGYDSSRYRHANVADYQYLYLGKEFIEFPHSEEKCPVSKFTPKASFEHKNVCTDKTQLDVEKPNMVTCSFGKNPYTTRCFNWVSGGLFDEYVWIKDLSDNTVWHKFESYKEGDESKTLESGDLKRKEFNNASIINNIYKRMTGRFPAANTQYTAHKCIINIVETAVQSPVIYTYIVGRADKNGNPDLEHCSEEYTFTLYPASYNPRIYLITDQQGFHWVEYQAWAAAANVINQQINNDLLSLNRYTLEQANYHNDLLEGAISILTVLTEEQVQTLNGLTGVSVQYEVGQSPNAEDVRLYNDSLEGAVSENDYNRIIPVLINTGDMTLSGARINEWLDYYNAGKCLFSHLEQMNVVGNNDLCGNDFTILGTGDDEGKANSYYFHLFYCYEVETGENMIPIINNKYIPSLYKIKFSTLTLLFVNSEITIKNCSGWFNAITSSDIPVNIYTGWEVKNDRDNSNYMAATLNFTPIYTMLYYMTNNLSNSFIAICHEMPFTVITKENLSNASNSIVALDSRSLSRKGEGLDISYSLVGSHLNQISKDDVVGIYWFSRLLEFRGCKLCIGGHKHTYSSTYPIMENYIYSEGGVQKRSSIDGPMTMLPTLENDKTTIWEDTKNGISVNLSKFPLTLREAPLETGGTRRDSYDFSNSNTYFYPSEFINPLTGFINGNSGVTYFMCLATGFKLMSNKELPSLNLTFSLYLPKSNESSGKATGTLRYPMYSVIKIGENSHNYEIQLIRLKNIQSGPTKLFTLVDHGTSSIVKHYLYDNSLDISPNDAGDTDTQQGWKYGGWTTTPTTIITI